MPDEKFKLPLSSYEELTKIIKAYGHYDEPAELNDVSRLISLHPTVISRNAGFLTSVGILQTGARKAPTPTGKELAQALEHNIAEEIQRWWRKIVDENEFLTKILAAIRIRSGMDQLTLESHVAYSAGQPKKSQFMTGARTVIDILKIADAVHESDGKYVADASSTTTGPVTFSTGVTSASTAGPLGSVFTVVGSRDRRPQIVSTRFGFVPSHQINININISCTPEDLDDIAPKIRSAIQKLLEEPDDKDGKAE